MSGTTLRGFIYLTLGFSYSPVLFKFYVMMEKYFQILPYTTLAFLKIYGLFIHLLLLYTYMYISKFISATCTVYIMLFVYMSSERTIVVLVPDRYACLGGDYVSCSRYSLLPTVLCEGWRHPGLSFTHVSMSANVLLQFMFRAP